MSACDTLSRRSEKNFFYKLPIGLSVAISAVSVLFFGGLGWFLLSSNPSYAYAGIFLIALGVAIAVGEFFEWKYYYILVTEDVIWTRNFLKAERSYPWDKCYLIYKKRAFATVDIYVHMRIRVPPGKRSSFSQQEVKEIWTSLPWSFLSEAQKWHLMEVIANSKLSPELKADFRKNNKL